MRSNDCHAQRIVGSPVLLLYILFTTFQYFIPLVYLYLHRIPYLILPCDSVRPGIIRLFFHYVLTRDLGLAEFQSFPVTVSLHKEKMVQKRG